VTVKGHQELPGGGREFCPLVATRSAQWWPPDVPRVLVQGYHSLPREGLGQADAVAGGLADVRVVHEPKARGFVDSWLPITRNPSVVAVLAFGAGRVRVNSS